MNFLLSEGKSYTLVQILSKRSMPFLEKKVFHWLKKLGTKGCYLTIEMDEISNYRRGIELPLLAGILALMGKENYQNIVNNYYLWGYVDLQLNVSEAPIPFGMPVRNNKPWILGGRPIQGQVSFKSY